MMSKHSDPGWLERPSTIRVLWIVFALILGGSVAAQWAIDSHGYFGIDSWFGFNAIFGFLACLAMVVFAKLLGWLLKRPDDFYEGSDGDRP